MRRVFVLLFVLVVLSCNQNKKKESKDFTRAFYYWQTTDRDFNFGDSSYEALKIRKLYWHFFDVGWDKQKQKPVPLGELDAYDLGQEENTNIVPVVFITNETFTRLDLQHSKDLAHKVHKKIEAKVNKTVFEGRYYPYDTWWNQHPYQLKTQAYNEQEKKDSVFNAMQRHIKEIQFDCDWTASTKEKYFAFLKEYKNIDKQKIISSTIRLYQYKYPKKAGVPPVDRGILMCYNAGTITEKNTRNSLFSSEEVMSYIDNVDSYPLELDYALPFFSWAVWFRGDKLQNILSLKELSLHNNVISKDDSIQLTRNERNLVTVTRDFTYGDNYNSQYIRKGDQLRIERSDMSDVIKIASYLSTKRKPGSTLALFHLNKYDFQEYNEEIKVVFDSF